MKTSLKQKAVKMRQAGWSYKDINNKLGISKSTLSGWLKAVPFVPNSVVSKRIKQGPAKSVAIRSQKRTELIKVINSEAKKELGVLSARDLWMLGIGIYIGEGTKSYEDVRVINSDPNVVNLAISWFNKVCGVPLEHFSLRLHIYPDVSEKEAKKYWATATGLSIPQFSKTQIDLRTNKSKSNHRKLPYGTAHLTVKSYGKIEYGVNLHRKIMAWIEECYVQFAGIV